MKNPTSNGNDLYQIGNDYPQAPISSYFVASSYHDGIYTELASGAAEYTKVSGVDGFDNSFFNLKTPIGLNKRVWDVLPQSAFTVSSDDYIGPASALSSVSGELYFADEYATGVFSGFPIEKTTTTTDTNDGNG